MKVSDISDITGLHEDAAYSYEKLYVGVLMHELAGEVLSCERGKLQKTELYLPKIGTIRVKFIHTKKREYEFIPDQDFDRGLLQVWRSGESPLIPMLETSVVDKINRKYNGLI